MTGELIVCHCGRRNPTDHRCCAGCGELLANSGVWTVPSWGRMREIPKVVMLPRHLRRTLLTAVVVGSILFCLNHLSEVIAGHATATVWLESGVTFMVPFVVSNIGVLIATRRPPTSPQILTKMSG